MAKSYTRPEGRRGFAEQPNVVKREVARPGVFTDSQPRDGTPANNQHYSKAPGNSSRYEDAASLRYREELGNSPYPGMNPYGAENPTVHSKGETFHGEPHSPGRVGSPGERAPLSGGREQLRKLYVDPIAPSLPHKSQPRATPHKEVVGWLNGVNHAPTHPNTNRHGVDGIHDARRTTDNAPGRRTFCERWAVRKAAS